MIDGAGIYIGLGSNLGDRLWNLRGALRRLALRDISVRATSSVYETEPVGPEQPHYLNAAAAVETDLAAADLLGKMLQIESELGRTRETRWGPRTLDLDLLLYRKEVIEQPSLKVPHPEMTRRPFVLVPLLELQPDLQLPSGERLRDFCPQEPSGVWLFAPPQALL